MFPIRIALGMKNVYFVYIFRHVMKDYLKLEIDNKCVINPDKIEMYTIRKPSDSFSENYKGFGPTGH
jgi:hypothetical protein